MAASPALWAVEWDLVWCLGLGLLLAAGRDLLGGVAGNGRILGFVWDVLAFCAASVLLCGFTAAASAGGMSRWYMAAGLAVGALAWRWAVSGLLHRGTAAVSSALVAAAVRVQRLVSSPLRRICRHRKAARREKLEKKEKNPSQKVTKRKKQLQNQRKILYN